MMTVNEMVRTLLRIAMDTNDAELETIVDTFIDTDDAWHANRNRKNTKATKVAYRALHKAYRATL